MVCCLVSAVVKGECTLAICQQCVRFMGWDSRTYSCGCTGRSGSAVVLLFAAETEESFSCAASFEVMA